MSSWRLKLSQSWLGSGPLTLALLPLSGLMRAAVALRRWVYRHQWLVAMRPPVPVIVIGNRVAGGAGKTPTTVAVLQHLQSLGWNPGVLTRGYGRPSGSAGEHTLQLIDEIRAPGLDASVAGDEPLLLWRRCQVPIMVGANRARAAKALLTAHPGVNILVCDDGLQHHALARDLEVVVFDERGAGNGHLLPAGPLREPLDTPSLATSTPALVLYNAAEPSTALAGWTSRRLLRPLQPLQAWWDGVDVAAQRTSDDRVDCAVLPPQAGQAVHAVAALAHPQRFFSALQGLGLQVQACPLPDHDPYSVLPWPAEALHVVVTEKDAVKLDPKRVRHERPRTQVWVAVLDLVPQPDFWRAFDARLHDIARTRLAPPQRPARSGS